MIDLEQLLRVPYVDAEFDISPDGTHVAFAWNRTGAWEIYELSLRAARDPWPVSRGDGAKLTPKFSPDGSRLAYLVDFDGGENYHIFVQPVVRNGIPQNADPAGYHPAPPSQTVDLTPNIDFAIQPNFCWSPDGTQIAFLADKTGCFAAYVMPASGGEPRLLLDNHLPAWDVTWSPDGLHLAVMSESKGQDYAIFIIPLDGTPDFALADETGPLNAHDPAWSPDGATLAFTSDAPNGFFQLGLFDMTSRRVTWLSGEQANVRAAGWSHDGAKLACVRARGASDVILVRSLADNSIQEFQVETGVHYKSHFTPDDTKLIFPFNNPRHPLDLWMVELETGEIQQLTDSIRSSDFNRYRATEVATTSFIIPDEITYPGMDGTPIPALLFKSEAADETTPAVILIHGGPNWHYQVEWYPFMAHLASRGWTVLAPNYRGSTGYGRDWQYANRYNIGGVDTDDVAAGVRYLLDNHLADPQRIAVSGRSHGGYLTMSCLTRYPDLWCAGSAVVPFMNWFTAHENSREDLQHWDIENFGNPVENHDLWYERSPFFFLDNVKAPVQLICGENDPRCPPGESIQARDKLLAIGRDVDFKLYEGEGHAFLKTESVVDAEVRRVNFLVKNLNAKTQRRED